MSYSLKAYNSFSVDHSCHNIHVVNDHRDLPIILSHIPDCQVIGGGSNLLLVEDLDKEVIIINNKGISLIEQDDKTVSVEVNAGETWQDVVLWALHFNYGGIENLSLIPGKCGAAPMQNIGAYGVELSDVLIAVRGYYKSTLQPFILSKEDCLLGYRDSIFKNELKNQVVITQIVLRLTKDGAHHINVAYGAIQSELDKERIVNPTIHDVSRVVTKIRSTKLPYPEELPNAGSFFKNPIVNKEKYASLRQDHPDIPSYPVDDLHVKIPAGWLIDRSGLKGYRSGLVGTHINQALVIVNYGTTSGQDILNLSKEIQQIVNQNYDILLEPEVNIL